MFSICYLKLLERKFLNSTNLASEDKALNSYKISILEIMH